jgi:hypothetical protein
MKTILSLFLILSAPVAFAQTVNPNSEPAKDDEAPFTDKLDAGHKRFWQASLPGGSYLVALDRIASVSKPEYLLDGNLIITEVNIDTVGNTTLRIYQITPAAEYSNLNGAQKIVERGKDLLDRAGQRTGTDPNSMVHKTYPLTTHAKIVEFRVSDLGTLDALLGSVRTAWISGKGRRFNVR